MVCIWFTCVGSEKLGPLVDLVTYRRHIVPCAASSQEADVLLAGTVLRQYAVDISMNKRFFLFYSTIIALMHVGLEQHRKHQVE